MATLPAEFVAGAIGGFDATTGAQTGEIGLWGRWLIYGERGLRVVIHNF
jgi:hypothetical protein